MKDYQNKGWIRLYRQIEDNPLWLLEPFTKAQAWIDLFLNANHKDNIIQIRGNVINIKRGQIGWSELTMVKRWKWSKDKVRRFLKLLENEQQIIQKKDRYITTIITIINYDKFQNDTSDNTAERQQKDSRQYINNNDNNDKNDNNINIADKSAGKEINSLIELFKPLNPCYDTIFSNKTERSALEYLVKKFGLEKVKSMIETLPELVKKPFYPKITKPTELKRDLAKIIQRVNEEKSDNKKINLIQV